MAETVKFMLLLSNRSNLEVLIEERRSELSESGLTMQPFIIIRGDSYTDISDNVIVVFDNTKYLFNSLLAALEALLKIYEVFNLEWPKPDAAVYGFFEMFFLKIKRGVPNVKIQQFIQLLTN